MTSTLKRLAALAALTIWLAGCATEPDRTGLVLAAGARALDAGAAAKRELRRVCPGPLAPATLEALADLITDATAPAIGDVDRLDREARACRGKGGA